MVGDDDLARLNTWAAGLDAAVRHARRTCGLGHVDVRIVDVTRSAAVRNPRREEGGVDRWAVGPAAVLPLHTSTNLVLLLSATIDLAPTALAGLIAALDDPCVGLVEPRRLPFQSLKPIDPATGDVSWASTDCCLVRAEVLAVPGGIDAAMPPGPGAEVDLSWRARLAGWSVRCAPAAAAYVHSPVPSGERMLESDGCSAAAKLNLAARYVGMPVARAWAAAWLISGAADERDAAARFQQETAAGFTDESIAGGADPFAAELFSFHRIAATDPGRYALPAAALRAGAGAPLMTVPEHGRRPFLSVIVRTQGARVAELEDNLTSLAAQSSSDFEVLLMAHDVSDRRLTAVEELVAAFPRDFAERVRCIPVTGGGRARPLNAGLRAAAGRYIAFLDDDDVAMANWVSEFRRVAAARPGAVVWSQVAWQTYQQVNYVDRPMWRVTEPPQLFVREFDLLAHLSENGTPNCAIAVPASLIRGHDLRFREDVVVFEDWDMILRLAQLAPFEPTGTVTSLYRRGSADSSGEVHDPDAWTDSARSVVNRFDQAGFFVRPEYLPQLRAVLAERRGDAGEDGPDATGGWDPGPDSRRLPHGHFAGRLVAMVSPHLDDAVLSCGEVISGLDGVTVISVFAGDRADWNDLTPWDEGCGFSAGTNVVAERIREDEEALGCVGARGVRLPFVDEQYRGPSVSPRVEDIGREILGQIHDSGSTVAFMPLGLMHGDHLLTAEAARWAAHHSAEIEWFAYQDLPYGYEGGDVGQALCELEDMKPERVLLPPSPDPGRKALAVDRYASQLRALGTARRATALREERYWGLTVPVAAT